ncbi:MAG TPA: acyl-CoA dehydratase activase [Limnochordia bacterium]|nr:acyl-CoA dehydratase activase [Limnochordia bacterium]
MPLGQGVYLGIDVGSVSTNFVLVDPTKPSGEDVVWKKYLRTLGAPVDTLKTGLKAIEQDGKWNILGVGTTGSGRELAGAMLKADVVKNEITAHAMAALSQNPQVSTIIEIGGQDSKIIILRDGVVVDFAMNTVCAAGTGSFLDQQAGRLNIPIEKFGSLALESTNPVRIAGRCTVFAESDMIHKQQLGHRIPDILAGLCSAMVRNYLSNVAKGKNLKSPVFFQGGVAANVGMQRFLADTLGLPIQIPRHFDVMGAIGIAQIVKEALEGKGEGTRFAGFEVVRSEFLNKGYVCERCPNQCEIVEIWREGDFLASWGSRCGRSHLYDIIEGS